MRRCEGIFFLRERLVDFLDAIVEKSLDSSNEIRIVLSVDGGGRVSNGLGRRSGHISCGGADCTDAVAASPTSSSSSEIMTTSAVASSRLGLEPQLLGLQQALRKGRQQWRRQIRCQ
jgi:hypothetical protein